MGETDNPPDEGRRGGFIRRHRRPLIALLVVALVVAGGLGFYAWKLNSQLDNIERFSTDKIKNRPAADNDEDLTVLLIGADQGKQLVGQDPGNTIADDAKSDRWPNGKYRSDSLMVMHISADRKRVSVVSIPRDSFVMLYNAQGGAEHKEKINAAFSRYGPNGALATVEHLTGLRIDHAAIIDWPGFKDLSTAVGGVPVHIPETFYDSAQDRLWKAGDYNLKGDEALAYVRTRYGLANGDFDRIARQQNFLRSLMRKVIDAGTLTNPSKLNRTLGAITENLTVDEGWSNGDLRSLALSMRNTNPDQVKFLTLPIARYARDPVYGSILVVDDAQKDALFTAVEDDDLSAYLKQHPDDVLPDSNSIE